MFPSKAKAFCVALQSMGKTRCNTRAWKLWSARFLSNLPDIKSSDIYVTQTPQPKPKPVDPTSLEFGKVFTDHMLTVEWSKDEGWQRPEIKPYQSLMLDPAAKCFHYSAEGFEGMKAYRDSDNQIRLFRPMENMLRLQRTSKRLCLPDFNGGEFLKCIMELIKIDKDWVPDHNQCSLYIRPTIIGIGPTLGVNFSESALLYCILSPVGPYFSTGTFQPVTLMADPNFVRSWHGGCGDIKAGGNYGPTLLAQLEAVKKNCEQVLWLYGEDEQITEVGTMNIFVFLENEKGESELITPPLDGLILPGVTRMSLLDLAREWNEFKVSERRITMNELRKCLHEGRVKEVFGAGTACVICPVKKILHKNQLLDIPAADGQKLAKRFYDELCGIQYGRIPSQWSVLLS